jgi:hypothetical protein
LKVPFYELFTEPTFHLLFISNKSLSEELKAKMNDTFFFPIKIVEYPLTESWKRVGVEKDIFILVRPDNYIAYIFDSFKEAEVKNYLERYFYSGKKVSK